MVSRITYRIEKIAKRHDRKDFDCGEESLNEYLRFHARQNTSKGISVTYVAVREGEQRVFAYYSISSGQVAREVLPLSEQRRLPGYPIPVIKIGRLASDLSVRGEGLGRTMLVDALRRSLLISENLGVYAVEVDALNERARSFYLRYGFESLQDDQLHLLMSIKTVRRLFPQ